MGVAVVQEDVVSEPAAAAPTLEEASSEASKVDGGHKRKLKEADAVTEANGAWEDANRPHMEGKPQVNRLISTTPRPSLSTCVLYLGFSVTNQ